MSDHLTPEDIFEFIDRGGGPGLAGNQLMDCPECLYVPDMILAEAPATPEEEAILRRALAGDRRGSGGAASEGSLVMARFLRFGEP
jgi:hypothetical protein